VPVTVKVNGVMNSLVHKGSNHISTATIPDVCKTPSPGGPVPLPYPNVSQSAMLAKGTTTVKADGGMMIANKGSEFSMSNGDEPGVAGGVKSSTFIKESTWILYSFDVKMDGKGVARLTDKKFQNHENTVDLMGTMGPVLRVADTKPPKALEEIAACCNKAVDCYASEYKREDGSTRGCTSRGRVKHKCCEEAVNRRNWTNVAGEKQHNLKPACKPDVRIPPTGKVTHIYDFKFNCDPVEPYMSDAQKDKYESRYGVTPIVVPAQGAATQNLPPPGCKGATKRDKC
jgi:hypothetical protein